MTALCARGDVTITTLLNHLAWMLAARDGKRRNLHGGLNLGEKPQGSHPMQ